MNELDSPAMRALLAQHSALYGVIEILLADKIRGFTPEQREGVAQAFKEMALNTKAFEGLNLSDESAEWLSDVTVLSAKVMDELFERVQARIAATGR